MPRDIDRPTTRTWPATILRVAIESGPGNREFIVEPRAKVTDLVVGSNDRHNRAVIEIWSGPTTRSLGSEQPLDPAAALAAGSRAGYTAFIRPDQEIVIYYEHPAADEDPAAEIVPIMSGYCERPRFSQRRTTTGVNRTLSLEVSGVAERAARMPHAQIIGRYMRTAAGQNSLLDTQGRGAIDANGDRSSVAAITALPCCFNAGGKANRAAAPITVDKAREQDVNVFTFDGDPDAEEWTFAQALRYLLCFYLYPSGNPDLKLPGTVGDGNIILLTKDLIQYGPSDRPTPPVEVADGMKHALLGRPDGLNLDKVNLLEALIALADQAQIGLTVDCAAEESGEDEEAEPAAFPPPVNTLRIWARGCGTVRSLHLTPQAAGTPAEVVLDNNDVAQIEIGADYSDVVDRPRITGAVQKFEITDLLVPGWEPDSNLDDVADLETAQDYAAEHLDLTGDELTADPWYNNYHRGGVFFHTNRHVGRRWVLNTAGLYPGSVYARTNPPFIDAMYDTWEPSGCAIKEKYIDDDGAVAERAVDVGGWCYRIRPFLPCFSADAGRRAVDVEVEFSCDSGLTYSPAKPLSPRVLGDDSAVVFDVDDLTQVYPVGVDPVGGSIEGSFWDAILTGTARVRVTCAIEGDSRIEPNVAAAGFSPAADSLSKIIDAGDRYYSELRDGANSQHRTGGAKALTNVAVGSGDRLADLQRYALAAQEASTVRQVPGTAQIPWVTRQYAIGDVVGGVDGLGLQFATVAGRQKRGIDVVGLAYADGQTTLVFDDFRALDMLERGMKERDLPGGSGNTARPELAASRFEI